VRIIPALSMVAVASCFWAPVSAAQSGKMVPQWVEHLAMNVTIPYLMNVGVRRAIASGVDRGDVLRVAMSHLPPGFQAEGPATSWFPPALPQYYALPQPIHPFDTVLAQKLLAEAGHQNGRGFPTLELIYGPDFFTGSMFRKEVANRIRSQLARVGIRVTTRGLSQQEFLGRLSSRRFQLALQAYGETAQLPLEQADFLSPMFLPRGKQNVYGYDNPDVTRLLGMVLEDPQLSDRISRLRSIALMILNDAPVVPLFYLYSPLQ
jgi:ABC-type transport system substrate-binding protein